MKYPIKLDKRLVWDYQISEEDLKKEDVLIFYLSRLLNHGSFDDISRIPLELIKRYLGRLYLSGRVKKFWKWYLKEK